MSVTRSARPLLLGLALSPSVGCATQAPDESPTREASAQLLALVSVEQLASGGSMQTNVSAKFLRVSSGEREAADHVVGARPALPPVGECVPLRELEWDVETRELSPTPMSEPRDVHDLLRALEGTRGLDLLDVGDVVLRVRGDAGHHELWLAPRAFPDVGEVVSGVFYTSPDASQPLPTPGSYAVTGTGSASADAFALEVIAPPTIEGLGVGGVRVVPPDEAEEPIARVDAGRDLALTWTGSDPSTDVVYVDVGGTEPHRCTFADEGSAVLPGALVVRSAEPEAAGELQLVVHRFRELRDALPSVDAGEASLALVRFDLARSVRVELVEAVGEQRTP
jgi:hypothetical protein